jgi:hypothetical protein
VHLVEVQPVKALMVVHGFPYLVRYSHPRQNFDYFHRGTGLSAFMAEGIEITLPAFAQGDREY